MLQCDDYNQHFLLDALPRFLLGSQRDAPVVGRQPPRYAWISPSLPQDKVLAMRYRK